MKRNLFLKTKLVITAALLLTGAAQLQAETKEVSTYDQLITAINDAQNGDIIQLTANIDTKNNGIKLSGKTLTIDLNGNQLLGRGTEGGAYKNLGFVYIENGSNITFTTSRRARFISDSNKPTIYIGAGKSNTVTLSGNVNLYASNGNIIVFDPTGNGNSLITTSDYSGLFSGDSYAIKLSGTNSVLEINGGTLQKNQRGNHHFAKIDVNCPYTKSASITINGGMFYTDDNGLFDNAKQGDNIKIEVNGGTFTTNSNIDPSYIKAGTAFVQDEKGNFSIKNETEIQSEAHAYYTTGQYATNKVNESAKYYVTCAPLNITDGTFASKLKDFYSFVVPNEVESESINYTRTYSGNWQAWYMPFDLDVTQYADKLTFYEFKGVSGSESSCAITVAPVTTGKLSANTPYLVKTTLGEPVAVTISVETKLYKTATTPLSFTTDDGTTFTFTGNYEKKFTQMETGWYGLAKDGTFSKQTTGDRNRYLNPFRFFLEVSGGKSSKSNAFAIDIDDDITGIKGVEVNEDNKADVIYDLQGRRVANTAKGVYIINGKKVLVK